MKKSKANDHNDADSIRQPKDLNKLFKLKDDSDFSTSLHQALVSIYNDSPSKLNNYQMNLFLCMHLENSGQSCGILSCLQEWFPEHLDKFVSALREINAPKCAEAIEKTINLLPTDGSWFFDSSSEATEKLASKYDSEFSNSPDGSMPYLYRKYAKENKTDVIKVNC